jgi:hypothetical protein
MKDKDKNSILLGILSLNSKYKVLTDLSGICLPLTFVKFHEIFCLKCSRKVCSLDAQTKSFSH